jgi:hypothetical protein
MALVRARPRPLVTPAEVAYESSPLLQWPRIMTDPDSDTPGRKPKTRKDDSAAVIHEHIGRELRVMFDDVVAEPIPDKFRALLEELERSKPKPKS